MDDYVNYSESSITTSSIVDDKEMIRNALSELEGFAPSQDMVASLFKGYNFHHKVVSSITPIKKGEPLDIPIFRPNGLDGWIINLTVRGEGKIHFSDGRYKIVQKGELCLFPPQTLHHYERNTNAEEWFHRWIYFQPYRQWADLLKWRISDNNISFLQLKEENYNEIEMLFDQVLHENYHAKFLSFELTINILEQILLKCQQLDQNALQWKQMDVKILKACVWINEHLQENFTIQQLADHVALSPSQLSHLFKKQIGSSIIIWKNNQLINQIALELRNSQSPINQLAYQFGFEDPLYFSRLFKKIHGVSPKKYRELWKKSNTK